MFKAQGTRSEEESVPRQGWRGQSAQGWFKRLSDLTVFPKQVNVTPVRASGSIRLLQRRKSDIHGG
ncbi:hypothetical protein AL522_10660 [Pantoea vagans]|nr:hypothetical protein AL522_10660 [Pantoea vagans]